MNSFSKSSLEATQWYYAGPANEPVGPLPFSELERLAATGTIKTDTFVIEESGTDWRPFAALAVPPLSGTAGNPDELSKITGLAKRIVTKSFSFLVNRDRKCPVILTLILLYPAGLVLLWRSHAFKRMSKCVLACAVASLYMLCFGRENQATLTGHNHQPDFELNEEVGIRDKALLFWNGDTLKELCDATRVNDKAKIGELTHRLSNDALVAGGESHARIVEVDNHYAICKVEAKIGDVLTQRWILSEDLLHLQPNAVREQRKAEKARILPYNIQQLLQNLANGAARLEDVKGKAVMEFESEFVVQSTDDSYAFYSTPLLPGIRQRNATNCR